MDVVEAIDARRSVREYEKRPIPLDILGELLDSARKAPSANNRQSWDIVVITDRELLTQTVSVAGGQRFVGECSAFLVGVIDPDEAFSTVDVTIALDHLSLRAVELGLGTCWIGDFDADPLKAILGIPREREISICMTLGYPGHSPSARRRKELSELFHVDRWDGTWP
jgi:nitroreductase